MDKNSQERREYFRINDKAIFTVKKIDNSSSLESLSDSNSSFLLGSSMARLDMEHQTVLSKVKRGNPDIAIYLDMINQKINLITKHILSNDPEISNQQPSDINLSASGIAIQTRESFVENDKVQVKLVLIPEMTGILCIGQVTRTEHKSDLITVHIDFTEINETDQEIIIKHNLAQQLEQARNRHQD